MSPASALPVAGRWFEVTPVDEAVTLVTEPHVDEFLRSNLWWVRGRNRDLLVDTGNGIASLRAELPELFEREIVAVATHHHADHIGGLHEFGERAAHRQEARSVAEATDPAELLASDYPEDLRREMAESGYPMPEVLIDALPREGFDPASFEVKPAAPTRLLAEGDAVDLGDRGFEVLHLPGHTPGSIGLWEPATGTLFSGDVIYDGPLLDELEGSNIADYVATMRRLRDLPVRVVHAGHDPSFGRERFLEVIEEYLARRAPQGEGP